MHSKFHIQTTTSPKKKLEKWGSSSVPLFGKVATILIFRKEKKQQLPLTDYPIGNILQKLIPILNPVVFNHTSTAARCRKLWVK